MRPLDLAEFRSYLQSIEPLDMSPTKLTEMAARIAITASEDPKVMAQAQQIVAGN